MSHDNYPLDQGVMTPRDVVADRHASATLECPTCRRSRQVDLWRVPPWAYDAPIASLNFRCKVCGTRSPGMTVSRLNVGAHVPVARIVFRPDRRLNRQDR